MLKLALLSLLLQANHLEKQWSALQMSTKNITTWDTGVPIDILKFVGAQSVSLSEGFVNSFFSYLLFE